MALSRQFPLNFSTAIFCLGLALITGVLGDGDNALSKEDPLGSLIEECPITEGVVKMMNQQCDGPESWFPMEGDYAPWTQRPMCVKAAGQLVGGKKDMDTFCTFTKRDFAEGRGISMITTPHQAKVIADLPAFKDPETIEGINDLITGTFGPPSYVAKRFPEKGIGLVANRTLVRGDRIMQETVTFLYHRNAIGSITEENRIPLHWHSVYSLPEETREELLALHTHHGGDKIDDIMRTNAFGGYYVIDELHNNMLPRISRFNHDCRPNAHYYFDPNTMTQYVHAVKEIAPGEEIVLSYTDSEYDWETRQQATMQSWGFACKCSVCRKPLAQIEHSDKRLRMIKVLKDLLNDWTEERPDRAKMAELMIELYKQERLYIGIATAYEAAAYAYSVMGDEYNTMLYASMAVDTLNIMYGSDNDLTKDLDQMMLNPSAHRTWLYSVPTKNNSTDVDELEEAE